VARGLLSAERYSLILAGSIGTILLTPFMVAAGPRLAALAERFTPLGGTAGLLDADDPPHELSRHSIVCGYGRLGAELAHALRRRGLPCVVVDADPTAVRRARADGLNAVYGDAGNPEVLRRVGIERARVLAVAVSDPLGAETAVLFGRRQNARLRVIARAVNWEQLHRLRELGADEVIQPEFEAGLESIRYVLQAHGIDQLQVSAIVQRRRETYYEVEPK
jgi:CPA2 family monovalent cation:H+ antiporter-2